MKYLTVQNTADILCVSKSTIYRWIANREIPHIKRGRRVLFDYEDIEQWLKKHRISTRNEELFSNTKKVTNERNSF